jgi:hypothetical protein
MHYKVRNKAGPEAGAAYSQRPRKEGMRNVQSRTHVRQRAGVTKIFVTARWYGLAAEQRI